MRKIILLVILILISCDTQKQSKRDLSKYFSFESSGYELKGKRVTYVDPIILETNDSIGEFIKAHKMRFQYLLGNRTERDSLKLLYPDTLMVKKSFYKNIQSDIFYNNFEKLTLITNKEKVIYSFDKVMQIASRFLLAEEHSTHSYVIRVCRGINGLDKSNKDYTVLEAVVYDAIYTRVNEEDMPLAEFLRNAFKNINDIADRHKGANLEAIRDSLYKSMEVDQEFERFIMKYIKANSENLPFVVRYES